jgi:hypothetical protein
VTVEELRRLILPGGKLKKHRIVGDGMIQGSGLDAVILPGRGDEQTPRFEVMGGSAVVEQPLAFEKKVDFKFSGTMQMVASVPHQFFRFLEMVDKNHVFYQHRSILYMFCHPCPFLPGEKLRDNWS